MLPRRNALVQKAVDERYRLPAVIAEQQKKPRVYFKPSAELFPPCKAPRILLPKYEISGTLS